jgi:hypothetical protein
VSARASLAVVAGLLLVPGCQCGAFHALDDYACDPAAPAPCPAGRACVQVKSGDFFCVVPVGPSDSGPGPADDGGLCDCMELPCTIAGCPPGSNTCVYLPDDGADCDDQDDCTQGDVCSVQICTGTELPDADGDGVHAIPCGGAPADCDEADPEVFPGAPENAATGISCLNGLDDDCDGAIDLADDACIPACDLSCGTGGCSIDCTAGLGRLDCNGNNSCSPTCTGPTVCLIDCTSGSGCDDVRCDNGAACRVDCNGAMNCQLGDCGAGQWTQCAALGNVWVCNLPCPP